MAEVWSPSERIGLERLNPRSMAEGCIADAGRVEDSWMEDCRKGGVEGIFLAHQETRKPMLGGLDPCLVVQHL